MKKTLESNELVLEDYSNERKKEAVKKPDQVDYSKRKRNLEWRENWFYSGRFKDDKRFNETYLTALDHKRKMIEKQKGKVDHMAGYGPAGAGTPWFSIGPRNINGRVKSLSVHPTDPNTIYAGAASGGIWKSVDGGQSWRPLWDAQDTMAIGSICIAPSTPNTIYAGTGEWTPGWSPSFPGTGVFVSTNGGSTWTQRTAVLARRISKIIVAQDNASHVYVAGSNGFEKSTDAGVTWTTAHAGEISDAVIDPNDAATLYINVRNDGIYKTTDRGVTWTQLVNAPTGADANWIKLAIGDNGTNGSNFLLAKQSGTINKTINGGNTWTALSGSHGAASYHQWCSMISVAPDDQDIILAGGVGIERTANGGTSWSVVGGLHGDHHQAVFAPSDTNVVYSCNDGGMYRSGDKGATWKKVSDGLIVTQFYDIGAWSTIGTVLGGGTQDNGTNMTTGGLTWKNILGADGGYFVMHPADPRIIYSEHQNTDLFKSVDGANSWVGITSGLSGGTPWTGVLTIDVNNPNTLFVGTSAAFKTTDGCATPWVKVSQDLIGSVTTFAIAESDSNRVYCGTNGGKLYRTDDGGTTTTWADITGTLPAKPIRDVIVDRTNRDRVVVCLGGGGVMNSVYLSTNGGTTWTNISSDMPNISVNALAFDPNLANTLYAGTDVGVFRTQDGGATWQAFDNGIPNVIITDLHIDRIANLLVAATFGRGMYKVSVLSVAEPVSDLYLRDSLLDTGERFPSPSYQPNPNDPTDDVYWWESPDIKVDVNPFYVPELVFDGVDFDGLTHEDPVRTQSNRFYLQVHNRGWQNATNVRVRAFLANASAGLPPLPNALTAPDFNLSSTVNWMPIGLAQTIPLLEPNRPVIVSWNYTVPNAAATHSCLLAVVSSAEDPISTTETNVDLLINAEKRVCLKNLHVITAASPSPEQTITTIQFNNARSHDDVMDIIINPKMFGTGTIGLLLEPVTFVDEEKAMRGVTTYALRKGEDIGKFYTRKGSKNDFDGAEIMNKLDKTKLFEFDSAKVSSLQGIKISAGQSIQAVITFKGSKKVPYGSTQQFTVMQRQGGKIVGGSTYEFRLQRAKGLLPVSRIKVVLEKIKILNDHEPWFKGRADVSLLSKVTFNDEACRSSYRTIPSKGLFKISDKEGHNEKELDLCVFDGYVSETDQLNFMIVPTEHDTFDPDDKFATYQRKFDGPPESWVGKYGPHDEANDKEKLSDWMVWCRIESLEIK